MAKPSVELRIWCPATRLRYTNTTQFIGSLYLRYYPSGWYRYRLRIYRDGKRVGGWERSFFVNPRCQVGERQGTTFSFELEFQKPGTHRVWVEVELFDPQGELIWKGRSNVVEVDYAPPGLEKRIEMRIIRVPEKVPLNVEPKLCPKIFGKVIMEGYPPGTYRLEIEAVDLTEDRHLSVSAKTVSILTETKRITEFPFIVNLYGFKRAGEHEVEIHARIFDEHGNLIWEDRKSVAIMVEEVETQKKRKREKEKEKEREKERKERREGTTTVVVGKTPGGLEVSLTIAPPREERARRRVVEVLAL